MRSRSRPARSRSRFSTSENLSATGDLDIYDDLTLIGAGPTTTIIDGAGIDRVFEVYEDGVVHLSRLAITGGGSTAAGGAIRLAGTAALPLSVVRPIRYALRNELHT